MLSALQWMFSQRYGFFSFLSSVAVRFIHYSTGENPPEHMEWLQKISLNLKYFHATGGPWVYEDGKMAII